MKKFLISLVVVAAMASVAMAGVGIQWESGWGGYTHTAPNITDGNNAILSSYSVIWQLVYSGANGTIDPPSLATSASGYVTEDDAVWATRTIAQGGGVSSEDGATWDSFMLRVGLSGTTTYQNSGWATAGSVYQRVFEGTPAEGTYWYDSPLFTYNEGWTSALPPQMVNPEVNPGAGGFQAPMANQFPAAVPEPATMSLLGLGALVMAIRRRRS